MNFSYHGIPIIDLQTKLGYLKSVIEGGSYEDAAGHLCDLLELCRKKIVTDEGMIFVDLKAMVGKYGRHPTGIEGTE